MTFKDKSSRGGKKPAGREHAKSGRPDSRSEARSEQAGDAKPKRFGKGAAKSFTVGDASEKRGPRAGGGKPDRAGGDRPARASSDRPARAASDRQDRAASDRQDRPRSGSDKPAAAKSANPGFGRHGSENPETGKRTFGKYSSAKDGMPFAKKPGRQKPFPVKEGASTGPRPVPRATDGGEGAAKAERISKIMARAGVASRRDIERMIMDGRVRLNGQILDTPVINATMDDVIEVDGVPIRGIERTRLWLYHKPAGLVTTNNDPEGRPTVFENLPPELPRVLSIGRLDINTEGLLLLTNDGGLSRVLELPATGWLRRYRVRAYGEIDQAKLDTLKEGIAVDGVLYGGIEAILDRQQGHNVWITMGLREGKNREIKNVLGALGLEVNRLIRLSYGPFQLGDLPEGSVVEVRGRMLRDQLGPRLIEESRANFDAPIYDAPAASAGEDDESEAPAPGNRGWEKGVKAERPSERGGERSFKPRDGGSRDRAPARGGKGSFNKEGPRARDEEPAEERRPKRPAMGTSRTANVWMAPGARPIGEKARAGRRDRPEDNQARPMTASPDLKGPRVTVNRAAEDKDWIRAEGKADDEKAGGFGRKKSFGDKPGGDRPRGDRPREDRPRGDGPRGDRPQGDRPRGERSFGDKPRGERSYGDKPTGDRPRGDRPREDRPREDRPRGERTFGDKPRGERSFGDRPSGGKSFGDRPSGGKPFGGKPSGGKSFGGKPSGSRPAPTRPTGGRPSGGRPSGGKPGGRGPGRG